MTVFDWLDKPTDCGTTVLQRLAELVMVNGGKLEVREIGRVESGGIYGRIGLTMQEAAELIYLNGFLQGLLSANDGREGDQVLTLLSQEVDRHEAANSPANQ